MAALGTKPDVLRAEAVLQRINATVALIGSRERWNSDELFARLSREISR